MNDVHCDEDDQNFSNCSADFLSGVCDHTQVIWLDCRGNCQLAFSRLVVISPGK